MSYKVEMIKEYAMELSNQGFRVYVSLDKGFAPYGFFTDGLRCVYFQVDGFEIIHTTCMKPSRSGGTGWRLGKGMTLKGMLYPQIPNWANSNGIFLTEDQYLEKSKHSNYQLFEDVK